MFKKILIANRGEIACRVAATARRLGIRTVAVYSQADAQSQHVAMCDESILIGPAPAKESYLKMERIISAARDTGAEAIHPGYGFLSENEAFAAACEASSVVFIGPPVSAIRAMGSKSAAKALMEKARVPLVPGYHGERQESDFLRQQADAIGYPVLLKASAGGGGKGMRIVERSEDFEAALASCKREAINSFGDDRVLVEKYLQRPRHIEIQVFADTQGNYVYLFERDCSVQRRHQKVLEEAPAPGMTPERRQAMGEAAVNAARAVGYVGAGTVEFIANQDGSFYFMEMNTRLQVEHPVTELITGTDLVEWQLRVAAGEPLPLQQQDVRIDGHAIEARVYAENPEKGFLPSTGTLLHLRLPDAVNFAQGHVRIDAAVRQGDAITPHYDPMIAKLIVHGDDRSQALARMQQALNAIEIVGPSTNVAFLSRLIATPAFAGAELDTGLIERHHALLFPPADAVPVEMLALWLAKLMASDTARHDPWDSVQGWRLNGSYRRTLRFECDDQDFELNLEYSRDGWRMTTQSQQALLNHIAIDQADVSIQIDGRHLSGRVVRDDDRFHVFWQGQHRVISWSDPIAHAGESESEGGRLTAPMPGKIVQLMVDEGASVEKGAPLLIMEAMKMEHTISAPANGKVEALNYAVGDQVAEGAQLLSFAPEAR
ncbi:MAG: acetyl/propionyl/methylcrotonyl-CoA carboxylase subunit alpha [Oxalobacteraceae bacterium]|nr:acetyl/propionyl/methylcrotonyl-CoA carboxylase subunit alpha [Oxalobacteraceae bacterium]